MIFPFHTARSALPIFSIVLLVAGCATTSSIQKAELSVTEGHYEEGISALETILGKNPSSTEARMALLRSRSIATERITHEARNALDAGRLDDAENLYNRLLTLDANNNQAKTDLQQLRDTRNRDARVTKAEELLRGGDLVEAERILHRALLENPAHRKALTLMRQITERQIKAAPLSPMLGPEFKKTISLEFREASLKDVFDAIWHASGINFILDRDVRSDTKASIYVRGVTIEEAVDALLITQQLAKKVVNAKTLFIYPKTAQKMNEYQDMVVRNFFLAYADSKQIQTMLKTILKIKEVYLDEKRNLLVIRDNQDAIDMAEKLIRAHDQAEPEVMLAIDVIEVKRSKLSEIGVTFPTQIAVGIGNPITVQSLRNLNSAAVNVGVGGLTGTSGPGVIGTLNLIDNKGNTNMLANPRIRVRNREKAKIHIGDRLPMVTTTSSSTSSFVGQTVNYLDVGLKLEVEPQVMLDDDVVTKINLEVSTATQSKVTPGFYDVGTRNTTTVLTIRDGETQVLAGLIRDDERESTSRLPGIGDIPLLGRLFTDESKSRDKTEIILAITPHILHNLRRPNADLIEYSSGTESVVQGSMRMSTTISSASSIAPPQPIPAALQVQESPVTKPELSAPSQPVEVTSFQPTPLPDATPRFQPTPPQTSVIPMMDSSP